MNLAPSDTQRIIALVSEACVVHAIEFPSEISLAERFARLREDAHAVWIEEYDRERLAVDALEAHWDDFTNAAFARAKEFPGLLARLDLATEPASMATTLLRPMGKELDEITHTRVLGALLDPRQNDQTGPRLLRAILHLVAPDVQQGLSDDVLNAATVVVEPEWIVGKRSGYPDLVIRLSEAASPRLVVIENKIKATDHEGQLDMYAKHALSLDPNPLLIYLTPSGTEPVSAKKPEQWRLLSYRSLATAWRRQLANRTNDGAWTEVLRLYLASIFQDVLGERLRKVANRADQIRWIEYLHAALGEPL